MPRLDAWLQKREPPTDSLDKSKAQDNKKSLSPTKLSTKPSSPVDSPKVTAKEQMEDEPPAKPAKRKRPTIDKSTPPTKKVKTEAPDLNALPGLKVVVTGVFDNQSREDIENAIKRRGGQVMSAVSGKTNILVHGSKLEDGRDYTQGSKFRKATELLSTGKNPNLLILDESAFTQRYLSGGATQNTDPPDDDIGEGSQEDTRHIMKDDTDTGNRKSSNVPLAEKWRPRRIDELVGNGETIRKLKAWLEAWETTHIHGKPRPVPPVKGFAEPERLNAKAAFLTGPPGIGKTTAAKVVAAGCGFSIVEFNASDDRGKSIVEVISDMTSGGSTITTFFQAVKKPEPPQRSILVMDEVDGLSGSDRGGAQALLKLISNTKIPVILIANDRLNPKLKTLISKTYDLRFNRPPKNTIANTLKKIGMREGLNLDYNGLELLVESVGNDVRQCINVIESVGHRKKVTYDDFRKIVLGGLKDSKLMSNPFEMSRRLLTKSESANFTLGDRLEGYFLDSNLMPLMVWENYTAALQSHQQLAEDAKLKLLASVADCYSHGDVMNNAIYKSGNWALLPDVAIATVVYPSAVCCSFLGRPAFPSWLGRNSTTTRNKRLCNEMCLFLSGTGSSNASTKSLVLDGYVHALYDRLVYNLNQEDGVRKCIEVLDEYSLSRTHLVEHMTLLRLKQQDKSFEKVDSKVKTSLTVTYNKTAHVIRMAPPRISVKRSAADGPDAPDEEQEEDETDMAYIDRLIVASKKRAKAKTKSRAKAKTKSSPKKRK